MIIRKVDINKYLAQDNFGCVDKELGAKTKWDNNFLFSYGVDSILESKSLSLDEKVKKIRQLVVKENDEILRIVLEIMLFNIKMEPLTKDDYDYYFLSYNSDYECFYLAFYTNSDTKKAIHYISRDTVEKIILNELSNDLNK